MRRDHGPARVAAAGGGAIVLVLAAVAVPLSTGAPRPALADLAVTAGFGAAAVRLAMAGRDPMAAALWLAAALWTATGLATSLPGGLTVPVSRLVLVPHALVVLALAVGQTRPRRLLLPALLAGAAALAAGNGTQVPVLALLGSALLAAAGLATPYRSPGVRAATAALGTALVVVDPRVLGDALDPRVLATAVDVLLLAIAGTATRQLSAGPLRLFDVRSARPGRDEVAAWLARVLGASRIRVAFPADSGAVDSAGRSATYPEDALPVRDDRGVVAYVSPAVHVDPTVHQPLVAMLRRLGEVARLRADCREQAEAIAASRGRLQVAADEESQRLERQLDSTLLARLDRIDSLLRGSSGSALVERVHDVRVELLRHARGLDPLAGRSLAEALAGHRARGVAVGVGELGDVAPSFARTAWYVATEAITNATKHATGSSISLDVTREAATLRVVVTDRGPGGADPDGAGLQGLADRVAAAGGRLGVSSGPDGTTVCCTLPCTGYPAVSSREFPDPTPAGRA